MKRKLSRFLDRSARRVGPRSHSDRAVYEYAWGWQLVRDDRNHWRGLVRFRGPGGVRVLLQYCPHRGDFVGPNTHEVPPAERLRAKGHLEHQYYSVGFEVVA